MLEKTENIRIKVSSFMYFNEWDEETIQNLCKVAKLKTFTRDQIILGGESDQKSYVYFVTEGACCVIECLNLQEYRKNNQTIYKLAIDTNGGRTHFINVCTLERLSCFNMGENLKNRQIVAITNTECLLIPYYWLLEHNVANIWMRIQQFLTWKIPKTESILQDFQESKKWCNYKDKLIHRKMKRKVATIGPYDIPYSLKVSY